MTCDEVTRMVADGPLPHAVAEHLSVCADCREFSRALNPPTSQEWPSQQTLLRLEQMLCTDLTAVRPMAPGGYYLAAYAATFMAAVCLSVYCSGMSVVAAKNPVRTAAILGTLAISAFSLMLSLVCQMEPGSKHHFSHRSLLVSVGVALVIAVSSFFQFHHDPAFWQTARSCVSAGLPISAAVAVPVWLLLRRGAILFPAVAGAGAGFLAGLAGTTVLGLRCPNLEAGHVLIGHLGLAAASSIAGCLLGAATEFTKCLIADRKSARRRSLHRFGE
jgi:Negative regulator of sigma F